MPKPSLKYRETERDKLRGCHSKMGSSASRPQPARPPPAAVPAAVGPAMTRSTDTVASNEKASPTEEEGEGRHDGRGEATSRTGWTDLSSKASGELRASEPPPPAHEAGPAAGSPGVVVGSTGVVVVAGTFTVPPPPDPPVMPIVPEGRDGQLAAPLPALPTRASKGLEGVPFTEQAAENGYALIRDMEEARQVGDRDRDGKDKPQQGYMALPHLVSIARVASRETGGRAREGLTLAHYTGGGFGRKDVTMAKGGALCYASMRTVVVVGPGSCGGEGWLYQGHRFEVVCLASHPEREGVASSSDAGRAGRVLVWEVMSLKTLASLPGCHPRGAQSMCFGGSGGELLATAGGEPSGGAGDHQIAVWDWVQVTLVASCKGCMEYLTDAVFFGVGAGTLATCGGGKVRVWTVEHGSGKGGGGGGRVSEARGVGAEIGGTVACLHRGGNGGVVYGTDAGHVGMLGVGGANLVVVASGEGAGEVGAVYWEGGEGRLVSFGGGGAIVWSVQGGR